MWPTLADGTSARCTPTSHTGENAWRTKGSGKLGGHKSVFLVRIDSCQHRDNLQTHVRAAEKHDRCVVDAGRFHYLVIDIPPDTICPRCDLIFNDTTELRRHLAPMEYPPPENHSLVINAETSVGAYGSDLWQKIRDRWRASRAERETKTHQTAAWRDEGRRDDGEHELGAEGICQGRQQEHGREAAQRRPQDALRTLSASAGSQRRSLHVLDDQARGARVQETERAIARLLGTGGDQGQGTRPRSARDSGFHGPVASAVGERQHRGSFKRGWSGKFLANVGRSGTGGSFRFGTSLQAGQSVRPSSEPSRTRHQRGTTPRTFVEHSDKQERIVFSVKLQSAAIEQN